MLWIMNPFVGLVAGVPARVQSKLLAAFLASPFGEKVKRPPSLDGPRDSKSPIPPEWSHHSAILSAKCGAGKGD
jgi:hypothetical protein